MDSPWSRPQLAAALQLASGRALVVYETTGAEESALVGFVLARRVGDVLEIDLVGVDPVHRRAGHARRLLEALIAREGALDAREVQLELAAHNGAAQALYAGLGFVVVGRRSRYYPDGEDALLLTLSLERSSAR